MARDRQLPGSKLLSTVHPGTGTPVGACIAVAVMAAIFFLKYGGAKPNETAGVLDFGLDFLNRIPILWSVLGTVLIVGALYYAVRSSKIPSPVVADREVPAPTT